MAIDWDPIAAPRGRDPPAFVVIHTTHDRSSTPGGCRTSAHRAIAPRAHMCTPRRRRRPPASFPVRPTPLRIRHGCNVRCHPKLCPSNMPAVRPQSCEGACMLRMVIRVVIIPPPLASSSPSSMSDDRRRRGPSSASLCWKLRRRCRAYHSARRAASQKKAWTRIWMCVASS